MFQYENGTDITSITLRQGQNFAFHLSPTYPITYAHCMDNPKNCFGAMYQFQVQTLTKVKQTECAFIFHANKQTSTQMIISPITTVGPSHTSGAITFKQFKKVFPSIHQGYTIRSIPVSNYIIYPYGSVTPEFS